MRELAVVQCLRLQIPSCSAYTLDPEPVGHSTELEEEVGVGQHAGRAWSSFCALSEPPIMRKLPD